MVTEPQQSHHQDGDSVVVDFELVKTDTRNPLDIARALRVAMGDSHRSATLTCNSPAGGFSVHSWDAETGDIVSEEAPAIDAKLTAVVVSDLGHMLVAVTETDEAAAAFKRMLEDCSDHDEDERVSLEAAANGVRSISLNEAAPDAGDTDVDPKQSGGAAMSKRGGPVALWEPDLTQSPSAFLTWQGHQLHLRARIAGVEQMQHLVLRHCLDLPDGGGQVVAIDGTFPEVVADIQLQLTCGPVIVDRYDLPRADVAAMRAEMMELAGGMAAQQQSMETNYNVAA